MISFWSLSESSNRVRASLRLEEFLDRRIAQNGDQKITKDWVRELTADTGQAMPEQSDQQRFVNDLAKGFVR